jgi:hypothetical protein
LEYATVTADGTALGSVASINNGPLAGMRNAIINGNFDIWQRGTSFTANGYGVDRWFNAINGSTCTMSRQSFTLGQTGVLGEPTYFCRMAVTSVAGTNNFVFLEQKVEGVRTFANQQVTVSFWAKADATKNISVQLVQVFGTGGSPSADVSFGVTKVSIGTGWQKVTVTATVPSISGKTLGTDNNDTLQLRIWFDGGSAQNANTDTLGQQSGTFDIAQVQVEPGPIATTFERRPIGTELSLCQRYYEVSEVNRSIFSGNVTSGQGYRANVGYQTAKRASATVTLDDGGEASNFPATVGSVAFGLQGFAENRTANGSGRGLYISNWTASAEL